MPPTVFRPVSATLPASRTASVSGSCRSALGSGFAAAGRDAGLGFGLAALARDVVAVPDFARAVVFGCAALGRRVGEVSAGPAEAADVVAAPPAAGAPSPAEPLRRLLLLTPGRDLGRLPRTPGSSLLSAATREK